MPEKLYVVILRPKGEVAEAGLLFTKEQAVEGATLSKEFVLAGKDDAGKPYQRVAAPAATEERLSAPGARAAYHRVELELSVPTEFQPAVSPLSQPSPSR